MGGLVEEALEVSLAGVEAIKRYSSELSFGIFLGCNAAYLIELGRYPEAAELLDRRVGQVLPGVSTIHLHATRAHLAVRTGDLDPRAITSTSPGPRRAGSTMPSS